MAKLQSGSMGLPFLEETLQFFTPNTSSDNPPFSFIKNRRPGSELLCVPTRGKLVSKLVPKYLYRDFIGRQIVGSFLAWGHVQGLISYYSKNSSEN
ncbi:hypothetical protein GBA52_026547 [Prunus armeniaca]|nr:hypothetical protein GBA52_026547 [Prunus armeniaca]